MTRRGWVLFAMMCVLWGVPYLLIMVAVEEITPATLVLARTAIGAALLLPFVLARRQLQPVLARWRPLVVFAVIEVTVPWWLLGYAEQRLDSSLTGLLVAGVPLVAALLVRFDPGGDRLDARRYFGLLVGLLGVAALVGFEVGAGDATAALAVAAVAVCYATGPIVLSRYLADLPGTGVITAALALAALFSAPLGIAQAPDHWPDTDALVSVSLLAVVCTAVAFVVFFELIAEVGPTRATVFTYVNPAVAAVLGALILDERLTPAAGVGFALILVGCLLATGRARPRPAPDCDGPDVPAEELARSLNAEP